MVSHKAGLGKAAAARPVVTALAAAGRSFASSIARIETTLGHPRGWAIGQRRPAE
jgi:hypothetical protein